MLATPFLARQAFAADTLNAYSIWPENYARPMMEAFEKASGIRVKFIRFSSGEALARVTAEKNNPQIDVLFGGPVETFTAGQSQGIFEPYVPPAAADLPARFKDKGGAWTAIADDPLVFMTNTQFLKPKIICRRRRPGMTCSIPPTRTCCRWPTRAPQAPR